MLPWKTRMHTMLDAAIVAIRQQRNATAIAIFAIEE
jgi:hypothetical protein